MDNLLQQMGYRLFERRKQLRLTQEDVAEKAGVTSQMISTAELGKKALRPENIIKLCTVLGISTDYLLYGWVTERDYALISEKFSDLTAPQYHHLEQIVSSFVAALHGQ